MSSLDRRAEGAAQLNSLGNSGLGPTFAELRIALRMSCSFRVDVVADRGWL